ncbi:hypothetical protein DESC_760024 [Desulfosarcina cetonica]|nr:hypothetical protein DESC_760024 [Desulfosarcina cetonica]
MKKVHFGFGRVFHCCLLRTTVDTRFVGCEGGPVGVGRQPVWHYSSKKNQCVSIDNETNGLFTCMGFC